LKWLAWACILGLFLLVALRPGVTQWDFRTQVDAARAMSQGLNPYYVENLRAVSENFAGLPYIYPLITLLFFKVFTFLPPIVGHWMWLALKIMTWGLLLFIWNREFVKIRGNAFTILFFLFSFNAALYIDLGTGNLNAFEGLWLWIGFLLLLKERVWSYVILVSLVAQFKLSPILFLALPLFLGVNGAWIPVFAGMTLFGAIFSVNYWLNPEYFWSFINLLNTLQHSAVLSSNSSLEMFRAISIAAQLPTFAGEIIYTLVAATLALISFFVARSYRLSTSHADNSKLLILFFCVCFAVISPRMKDYTFTLLIVPTLYILRQAPKEALAPLACLLFLLPHPTSSMLPVRALFKVLYDYIPLMGAYIVWWLYLGELRKKTLSTYELLSNSPSQD
jgi:hypothetical protein